MKWRRESCLLTPLLGLKRTDTKIHLWAFGSTFSISSVLNWEELMFEIGLTLALLPPAGEYKVMHASVCLHHAAIPQ